MSCAYNWNNPLYMNSVIESQYPFCLNFTDKDTEGDRTNTYLVQDHPNKKDLKMRLKSMHYDLNLKHWWLC
jgi:hypothetical protein